VSNAFRITIAGAREPIRLPACGIMTWDILRRTI